MKRACILLCFNLAVVSFVGCVQQNNPEFPTKQETLSPSTEKQKVGNRVENNQNKNEAIQDEPLKDDTKAARNDTSKDSSGLAKNTQQSPVQNVQNNPQQNNTATLKNNDKNPKEYTKEFIEKLVSESAKRNNLSYEKVINITNKDFTKKEFGSKNWVKGGMTKMEFKEDSSVVMQKGDKLYLYGPKDKEGRILDSEFLSKLRTDRIVTLMGFEKYIDFTKFKYIAEEKVNGYDCIVFEANLINENILVGLPTGKKIKCWVSKEFGIAVKFEMWLMDTSKGEANEEYRTGEIKNISKNVDYSVFELPSDVKFKETK